MNKLIKISLALGLIIGFQSNSFAQKSKKELSKKIYRKNVTYKKTKKKVTAVRTLSKSKKVIKHNGRSFYYDNNKFYRLNGGRYVPVTPNVGLQIRTLPVNYKRVVYNKNNYFLYNGIFYKKQNNFYEVVRPARGTIIYDLPNGYEKVIINNELFYEYNNTLYEKVKIRRNRAYKVVGFIEN